MIIFRQLLADYEEKPIGLTSPPYLSWSVECDSEYKQKYFKIAISSDFNDIEKGDIFTSCEILEQKQGYDLRELSLAPFTRYFWKVGVCNEYTNEFVWSEVGEFITSILRRSQWTAFTFRQYETLDICMERKEFITQEIPDEAYFFIAAGGEKSNGYHAYINGKRVGNSLISPGPLEYMTMNLIGFDVTELIEKNNVINIDHLSPLSCVLKLYYKNGLVKTVETDKSWEIYGKENPFIVGYDCPTTPTRHHGKYELFNSHKMDWDWYKYGCKAGIECTPGRAFWGALIIRYAGVRTSLYEKLKPLSIIKTDKGYVADFGKIQSGFVSFTMHGIKAHIKTEYAEYFENGEISITQLGGKYPPITEYVSSGEDNEEYHPYFMHTSFRYVLISGLDYMPVRDDLEAWFIYSDVDDNSHFECSNQNLNYIEKCIRRSYRSNLLNVPTDCPGRERRGWTADSYAVIDSQCMMFDVYRIYDRWFHDLQDNQRMNGWCTVEYPDQTDPCIDINWPMHIIIDPCTLYEHYGDKRILANNIDNMERYAELLYELSDNNMLSDNLFCYGDWVSIVAVSKPFLGISLYYYVCLLLSNAEKALGRNSEAIKYLNRSREIKDTINNTYYFESDNEAYYDDNKQTSIVLALMFGFFKDGKKDKLFKTLTADIEGKQRITVGVTANTWLYRVLSDGGRNDLAYDMLTNTDYSGACIMNMVNKLKNETLNESFKTIRDSLNHAFLGGGPGSWIYRCLAGIKPIKCGYSEYEIKPYFPDDMSDLDLSIHCPYGEIRLKWKRSNKGIEIEITAPYNAVGTFISENTKYDLKGGLNKLCRLDS